MKILDQSEDIRTKLKSALESCGFGVVFRNEFRNFWDEASNLLDSKCISASHLTIDYFIEYEQGNGRRCEDYSLVILVNKKPVAIWPLSINTLAESSFLASPGGLVSCPLYLSSTSAKLKEKVAKSCYKICIDFAKTIGQKDFLSVCFDADSSVVSPWQLYAMQLGASCSIKHEALIDLCPPIEKIRSTFRRSYKSLLNKSEKIWNSCVVSQEKLPSVWKEFKDLHYSVSQRRTRSDLSWTLQQQAALSGEGFLVAVYTQNETEQRLIGAGFFLASQYEGGYAVGAYDRSLFDQPVSHIVQLRAIEELKRRGCRWYHIGRCYFPGDIPTPDKKALSISHFKSGFANHFSCSYVLTHQLIKTAF